MIDEYRDLAKFIDEVGRHTNDKTFNQLPIVRCMNETLGQFHSLRVGPWRGIFLVAPSGSDVLAVVFSKYPHRLEKSLEEIVKTYEDGETNGEKTDTAGD